MKRYPARSLVLVGALLAAQLASGAQPATPRIGVVAGGFSNDDPCLDALRQGLSGLGYVEGQTYVLEPRWSEGRSELFSSLAADLARSKVDLIVSTAGPAALAVKEATSSIPIVLASSLYPVELGVIASLAHPGGNVTGMTHFTPELMAKRVQLLKEIVPSASRFAVLRIPGRVNDLVVRDMEAAARQLGVPLQVIEVRQADELPAAFDSAVRARAQAIMTTQAPLFFQNGAKIARLALKHRLPSLSGEPNAAESGALLFYGPSIFEGCRRASHFVDRILKGAKPADLPVEQPTKFELVINVKTAKALRLTVPQSLLVRADKVIE